MGKRKIRWRTLELSDNHSASNNEMMKTNLNNNNTTNSECHQNGYSGDSMKDHGDEKKPLFNEDEYTKITTPRQDVLFKKNYINRRKYYTCTSNSHGVQYNIMGPTTNELENIKIPPLEYIEPTIPTAACYDGGINGGDYEDGYGYYAPTLTAAPAAPQSTFFDSNNGILYAAPAPAVCLINPFYNPAFIPANLQSLGTEQYNGGPMNGNGEYEEIKPINQTDDECDLSSMSSATSTVTETQAKKCDPKIDQINENEVSVGNTVFRLDAEEFIPQSMRNKQNREDVNVYKGKPVYYEKKPSYSSATISKSASTANQQSQSVSLPPPTTQPKMQLQSKPQQPGAANKKPEISMKATALPLQSTKKTQSKVLKSGETLFVEPKNVVITSTNGNTRKPVSTDDWIVAVSNRKRRSQYAQQRSVEVEMPLKSTNSKSDVFQIPPLPSKSNEEEKKPVSNNTNGITKKKQKKTTKAVITADVTEAAGAVVQKSSECDAIETVNQTQTVKNRRVSVTSSTPPPMINLNSSVNSNHSANSQQKNKDKKKPKRKSGGQKQLNLSNSANTTPPEIDTRTNLEICEEIEREIQQCLENEVQFRLNSIDINSKDDNIMVPALKLPLKSLTHSAQFGAFSQTNSILAFHQLPTILTNKAVDISFKNNQNTSHNTKEAHSSLIANNRTVTATATSPSAATHITDNTTTKSTSKSNGTVVSPIKDDVEITTSSSTSTSTATATTVIGTRSIKTEIGRNTSDISSTVRTWFSKHHGIKALKTPQQLHILRTNTQQKINPDLMPLKPNTPGFLTAASHVACTIS